MYVSVEFTFCMYNVKVFGFDVLSAHNFELLYEYMAVFEEIIFGVCGYLYNSVDCRPKIAVTISYI